jgi:hypothetical protein
LPKSERADQTLSEGITFLRDEGDESLFAIGAGQYQFVVPYGK